MGLVGLTVVLVSVTAVFLYLVKKFLWIKQNLDRIQGPTALPFIGNLHQLKFASDEFFEQAQGISYMFRDSTERMCRIWLGPLPFVLLYGAEECEAVLGSSKMLTKMFHYNHLAPWIGQGLLISKPEKWRPRRKMLTPTFHYDILKDFVEVYNRHASTLISKFHDLVGKGYNDVFHTITLCTLDVICESALGININAQKSHTDYLDAVFRMKAIVHNRNVKAHFYSTILFYLFGDGFEQDKCVKILHEFTSNAIEQRRTLMQEAGGVAKFLEQRAEGQGHRRMAFLDLMLDLFDKGELDRAGIQEEVDTFTFEGHDTTSAAMNFFLHLVGSNPEIQSRIQREIDEVIGDQIRDVTFEDIGRLKYLEACLKETLRMYPSVPLIARQTVEDTQIKDKILPAGTGVVIVASMVHRDPRYWENPEVFDPERFLDSELKHPYQYIPFSAGSRNCIGQRFAMMEEKCIIARILREFKVQSKVRTDQLRLAADLIIRPKFGNFVKFQKRQFGDYSPILD
uniref:Cytochrome P450 n=1 Tax=Panagrolaimus sp. JU765 TaxID=591449 RepID=A0AC34QXY8_9BILA